MVAVIVFEDVYRRGRKIVCQDLSTQRQNCHRSWVMFLSEARWNHPSVLQSAAGWRIHMWNFSWHIVSSVASVNHKPIWIWRKCRRTVEASCASCMYECMTPLAGVRSKLHSEVAGEWVLSRRTARLRKAHPCRSASKPCLANH